MYCHLPFGREANKSNALLLCHDHFVNVGMLVSQDVGVRCQLDRAVMYASTLCTYRLCIVRGRAGI